ncbi:outer membrane lipoprotein-sorting protein [Bradymonas sediminis]|uniref:Outer membrane lipoprotein-sorting protein n=1 Tax=Bradymonas sediminis TaxID=1548548 RepID=A0A2Z4FIZ2_9DELT|nr:outer membrane lipoprotein-sorting protein [Bradymonas sediminis]AWV88648.1 outer membrane lipoprotein-sorting protein [Bradymonas sediminis]TDP63667.1 outer membrane lipoprotein-sorting protein [Bradymonas sediminis]
MNAARYSGLSIASRLGVFFSILLLSQAAFAQATPEKPSAADAAKTAPKDAAKTLSDKEMLELLEELDRRQHSAGDYEAQVYIDQREKDKSALLYEATIYRRDAENKMIILFEKPRSEAGKGYLRIDKNLFMYDPNVGKWERRTERERIGGTGSQRSDFDEWELAKKFVPSFVGVEKLGKFEVHHLKLKAKDRNDVAYPIIELWLDTKSKNVLKQQEFALSGRLMRTTYYPKWSRLKSEEKKDWVYFPKEIRIFDEVEKGNRTTIVFRDVALKPLPGNIFTKAWLESKSR